MIIDNVPEQVSEDDVIELANEFTEYLENSGNLFFKIISHQDLLMSIL